MPLDRRLKLQESFAESFELLEKVLLGEGSVEEKVERLISKANNRGGTDNISVAYLTLEKEGDK